MLSAKQGVLLLEHCPQVQGKHLWAVEQHLESEEQYLWG